MTEYQYGNVNNLAYLSVLYARLKQSALLFVCLESQKQKGGPGTASLPHLASPMRLIHITKNAGR